MQLASRLPASLRQGGKASLAGCRLPLAKRQPPSSSRPAWPQHAPRQRRACGPVAVVAAAAGLVTPTAVFDAATALVMPFYIAMVAAPRKPFTRQLMGATPLFAAAGALYGLLLAMWNPLPQLAAVVQPALAAVQAAAAGGEALRSVLPSIPAFAALFGSPEITALAWVNLVLLDLVQARWVYRDGLRNGIPVWHSAILCFMVGPLGLLCHLATKKLVTSWRSRGKQAEYVIYRF